MNKLTRNPERISATLSLESPDTIFVRQFYFPGWDMEVDGLLVPLKYDNPNRQMAFFLPEGKHNILLRYRGTGLVKAGRAISFAALFLLIIVGFVSIRHSCRDSLKKFSPWVKRWFLKLKNLSIQVKMISGAMFIIAVVAILSVIQVQSISRETSIFKLPIDNVTPIGSPVFINSNYQGNRLFISYLTFETGIQTYGNVSVEYRLSGKYKKLSGWVGLDDSSVKCKRTKPVHGVIYADGKPLFKSRALYPFQPPAPFELDITGVKTMIFSGISPDSKENCFYLDWIKGDLVPE